MRGEVVDGATPAALRSRPPLAQERLRGQLIHGRRSADGLGGTTPFTRPTRGAGTTTRSAPTCGGPTTRSAEITGTTATAETAGKHGTACVAAAGTTVVGDTSWIARASSSPTLKFFVGWIPNVIEIQWIRLVHFLFMFFLMGFFIHHVYSAVLVAMTERNAEMEGIFSGYKFVPEEVIEEELNIANLEPRSLFKARKIHRNRTWDR